MKKIFLRLLSISILGAFVVPVYADSVLQVWSCKVLEGKTGAELEAVSAAWFKAAKGMKGGEHLEVHVLFPIVSDTTGGRVLFVVTVPSFEEWGVFTGGYEGSPAAKADEDWNKVASCSGNALWESVSIK